MKQRKVRLWAAASKWRKHQLLSLSPLIKHFLPETAEFNLSTLEEFFTRYTTVFLKPVFGSGGYGIMRVTKLSRGYELRTTRYTKWLKQENSLSYRLKHLIGSKPYIIQQGIDLMCIGRKPIDFRVLLLKPQYRWEVMGIMGKLGQRDKIVTNYCQGSKAIPLQKAIDRSEMENKEAEDIEKLLVVLGLEVAELISKRYRYVREIGLDVAIDVHENIWIIEANTRPNFRLFKHHPDRFLYAKIYRYLKQIRNKGIS